MQGYFTLILSPEKMTNNAYEIPNIGYLY